MGCIRSLMYVEDIVARSDFIDAKELKKISMN